MNYMTAWKMQQIGIHCPTADGLMRLMDFLSEYNLDDHFYDNKDDEWIRRKSSEGIVLGYVGRRDCSYAAPDYYRRNNIPMISVDTFIGKKLDVNNDLLMSLLQDI